LWLLTLALLVLLPLLLLALLLEVSSRPLPWLRCWREAAAVAAGAPRWNSWYISALCDLAVVLPQRLLPAALADCGLARLHAAALLCWLLPAEGGREQRGRCTSELASAADSSASADSTDT
jgi:hypothetical protein